MNRNKTLVNLMCNKGFLLATLLLLSNSVSAQSSAEKERWFEVEVIIFTQNNDKSLLKETFPDNAQLPKQRRVIELITPFLKPDIRSLKALLPECGQNYSTSLLKQSAQLPNIFVEKSLAELNATATLFADKTMNMTSIAPATITNNIHENTTNQVTRFSDNTDYNNAALKQTEQPLDAETIALVKAAEHAFNPIQLTYLQSLYYQTNNLCRLPQARIKELKQADSNFNEFDFTLDKVPSTLDAAENIYSDKPYLLSKSSLKLGNIVKHLRWSKEFTPLLHLGWRLAPKDRKFAIPVHIFAGDNLQADYQKRLQQYQQEHLAEAEKEAQLQQILLTSPLSKETQQQQKLQANITQIVTTLENFQKDTTDVLAEITQDKSTLNTDVLLPQPPQPPLQDWFLEGFFKVHLNHYLFISADFTILNKTLAEQAQDALKQDQSKIEPLKLIPFSQNRRVISKEIHYFDHPYFGMIVQIRRYKRPMPTIENEPLATLTSD